MGIFSKLAFWKKEKLPDLPEEASPLEGPSQFPPQFQDYSERKPFNYPEPPQFNEPSRQFPSSEFQVISSKLDVLNAKIEVLNEKINNLERNLNNSRSRW